MSGTRAFKSTPGYNMINESSIFGGAPYNNPYNDDDDPVHSYMGYDAGNNDEEA